MADQPASKTKRGDLLADAPASPLLDRQRAELVLRVGRNAEFKATVDVTSIGLLSITVLVSGILLSTSVLVGTAVRESKRFRW